MKEEAVHLRMFILEAKTIGDAPHGAESWAKAIEEIIQSELPRIENVKVLPQRY